jgi:hypothetical protein
MSIDKEKKPVKAPAKPKKAAATASTAKKAIKTEAAPRKAAAPKAAAPKKAAVPKPKAAAEAAIAAGVPEAVAPVAKKKPTHDEIAFRAYFIFLERNGHHGQHDNDWLRAERELMGLL